MAGIQLDSIAPDGNIINRETLLRSQRQDQKGISIFIFVTLICHSNTGKYVAQRLK